MAGITHRRVLGMLWLICALASNARAGSSGLNVAVVVNQQSSNSCALANYFVERRQVPPQNVLRINWAGGNIAWTSDELQSNLITPLLNMLSARQLTNQIDFVVLSMDIPFETTDGATVESTTSALFYGVKTGSMDPGLTNSYAASEAPFRQSPPDSAPGYSFLTTMITGNSLAQAEQLVDQGVNSDGSYPIQPVVLAKSSDPSRNIRYPYFDNAIFNVQIRGVSSILRTNADSFWGPIPCLGFETGLDQFNIAPDSFIPGALADSLTSFGGIIFGPNTQTNLLNCINAGAAGSYGTVAEPGTDPQKFPNPQVYFYQARGFNLAESYYQSINVPYLGLMVAEPLGAPFAKPGYGAWAMGMSNSIVSGITPLSVQFSAAYGKAPLEQVDLFVDGTFLTTLTNLPPGHGNQLTVALNGYPVTYTVPPNATVATVAAGLAAAINDPIVTNATQAEAFLHGDRIELQTIATNPATLPFYVPYTPATNGSGTSYNVNYLPDSSPPQMVPTGRDKTGVFHMDVEMPAAFPYVIQASTNLIDWTAISTNVAPGLLSFEDSDASNYPVRFYRVIGQPANQFPLLSNPSLNGDGTFQMEVNSEPGQPCAVLASTNLATWQPVWTNTAGGDSTFVDSGPGNWPRRYYKAWLVPPAPPAFSLLTTPDGLSLVRVDSAARPYVVQVSTNQNQWDALDTNFAVGQIQTDVSSDIGSGSVLSTFLSASRSRFLASDAYGLQTYSVIGAPAPIGTWLQFTITKTNGQSIVVGFTNQSASATSADVAAQLYAFINANSGLQGGDGLAAEDFAVNPAGTANFNLRARAAGMGASCIKVLPKRYGLIILPSSQRVLNLNLSDLEPRNHLYVRAGAAGYNLDFLLNTTQLSDGYHELTAVSYDGTHVRTQTRATASVWVRNTGLSATLTLLDIPNPAPVHGIYHIQVDANTNAVSSITLFSTGGPLASTNNLSSAVFEVDGTNLWAGLHPFYAIVTPSNGAPYRTEPQYVRLTNP